MWADKPMPDTERRILGAATAAVWLFALAVNVNNVERHLRSGGASEIETTWLRWAPDVLLLVGAWKLRYRPRSAIAWSMLGLGVAWLVWAGLSMAAPTATGRIVSLLPILVALLMTLALEFKPAPEPAAEAPAPVVDAPTEPAPVLLPAPDPATDIAVQVAPAPRKVAAKPKGCPTRVAARQILLDLDPVAFETTSNAELGRLYGGSDNWWGQRRREVADELAKIGGQA
jgi:hypothetical protein